MSDFSIIRSGYKPLNEIPVNDKSYIAKKVHKDPQYSPQIPKEMISDKTRERSSGNRKKVSSSKMPLFGEICKIQETKFTDLGEEDIMEEHFKAVEKKHSCRRKKRDEKESIMGELDVSSMEDQELSPSEFANLSIDEKRESESCSIYTFEIWDPFEHFKTNLAELKTLQLKKLFADLKENVHSKVNSRHYCYDEAYYEESTDNDGAEFDIDKINKKKIRKVNLTSCDVKLAFRTIFEELMIGMEDFWEPFTSRLYPYNPICNPVLNPDEISNKFAFEPDQENIDATNLDNSLQIILEGQGEHSGEPLPLLLLKAKNDVGCDFEKEADVLCGYLEALAQKWPIKELYGLVVDSREIEFIKYDYTRPRNALKSRKIPFTIRGYLKEKEESQQMGEVVRIFVCMMKEALKKLEL